jgi:diadenylate cyclase
MDQLLELARGFEVQPIALLDVALTALLIYGLFSLIRGTRAVRLVIGLTVLYGIYVAATAFKLQLLTQILQAGAVVGLLALVVVFQPEMRRALERIGRVGSMGWLVAPGNNRSVERVASVVARSAAHLGAQRTGALIVLERETGLQDTAETGVMLNAELSFETLGTIFTPHSLLHDGAVLIRGELIAAAAVVLPLSETGLYRERFGTRHRAALGITEQTDALVVVVSDETGSVGLVERGRIVRNLDEDRLRAALLALLGPGSSRSRLPAQAEALRRGLPLRHRPRPRRPPELQPPRETPQSHAPRDTKPAPATAGSSPAATPGSRAE